MDPRVDGSRPVMLFPITSNDSAQERADLDDILSSLQMG